MGAFSLFHWLILCVILLGPIVVAVTVIILVTRSAKSASPMRGPNLTSCPDCGQAVSRLAKACPHCGRPVES
jgi:hypothetical protein